MYHGNANAVSPLLRVSELCGGEGEELGRSEQNIHPCKQVPWVMALIDCPGDQNNHSSILINGQCTYP